MKLITLNAWGGRVQEPFDAFLNANVDDVDVFCFQEVYKNSNMELVEYMEHLTVVPDLYEKLSIKLKNYVGVFCGVIGDDYGIATFVKKDSQILSVDEVMLYESAHFLTKASEGDDHTRKMQWLKIKTKEKEYIVMHVHGHWTGKNKNDNPARLEQSQAIVDVIRKYRGMPIILCGDFNLRPDTESVKMLEREGMINLVSESGVTSTRTSLYPKPERFADYIFISPRIKVKDFKVLPDVVSDHSPLYLDFEIT